MADTGQNELEEGAQQPQIATEEKLTEWKNEPTILSLKQDLENCKFAHDEKTGKIEHWNDLLRVRGNVKPAPVKGRSRVQPKLVRKQAEWRYSALSEPFLSSKKLFQVDPATFEDAEAARQNELVLNWQFRTKLNRVAFIDNYVRSTVDDGTCIVRISWKRITKKVKKDAPVWEYYPISEQAQADALQQAMGLKQENPRAYNEQVPDDMKAAVEYYEETQQPTVAIQNGTQEVETEIVIENKPCLEILNPANAYIDPSCNGDFDKAMFAVISFETCKADLEKDAIQYKNLDKVHWDSNSPITDAFHKTATPNNFRLSDPARKKVVAYEYWGFWDIEGNDELVPIVATWIGNTLIRMELNPYPDQKIPLVVVPYSPLKRELYGESDAELLEDNQAILGAVTRGMIDLLGRSANGQQGFAKGMLDPLNRRRYEEGRDYEFNPNLSPVNGLIEHKYPEIPQSAMAMLTLQNEEAEALTGVKSFSGGISGMAYGDVAVAVRGAMDAASKREMAILRRLAKGMQDIGTKIIAMNSEFLSEEETVRVTNEEFVKVKREDLKGNFDLLVDIATAEVDDAKSKDLAFMLQTCGPSAGPQIVMLILAEIAELKRMPVLAQKLRSWTPPPPDPMQVQSQQLELEKLKAEVMKIQSEIVLNQARAKDADAKGDKTRVEAIEQETGTTHVRNMELQRAQSQGNQALEVTKALTRPKKEGEANPNIAAAVGYNHMSNMIHQAEDKSSSA